MITAKEHYYELLPKEYADLATKRSKWPDAEHDMEIAAIAAQFSWEETPEGFDFWYAVFRYAEGETTTLPPLPEAADEGIAEKGGE